MVSFDVTNLFTNIPTDKTLEIVQRNLEDLGANHQPDGKPQLNTETIIDLLKICTSSAYFQYKETFYKQKEGLSMGSPLSPVLADIFMCDLENKAINTSQNKPRFYKRYVDDIFCIFNNKQDATAFLTHINTFEEKIKFTVEEEQQQSLPFLDTKICRQDRTWVTTVYRKNTHTGQYLNFTSNHPLNVKRGIISCLQNRATHTCSNQETLKKEQETLRQELQQNGYPKHIIEKTFKQKSSTQKEKEKPHTYITIPYIQGLSEEIKRVGQKYNIHTSFKNRNTLKEHLVHVKPPNITMDETDVVYNIPLEDGKSYVGETKQKLKQRIKNHKDNLEKTKRGEQVNSKLSEYQTEQCVKAIWDETTILTRESNTNVRKIKEALFMENAPVPVVSLPSRDVGKLWNKVVKPEIREQFKSRQSGTKPRSTAIRVQ
jgi:predicted GIY-YIG superfamily endonuclease